MSARRNSCKEAKSISSFSSPSLYSSLARSSPIPSVHSILFHRIHSVLLSPLCPSFSAAKRPLKSRWGLGSAISPGAGSGADKPRSQSQLIDIFSVGETWLVATILVLFLRTRML